MNLVPVIIIFSFCSFCVNAHEDVSEEKINRICGHDRRVCDPRHDELHKPLHNKIWNNILNQDQILKSSIVTDPQSKVDHYVILNSTTKVFNDLSRNNPDPTLAATRNPRLTTPGSNTDMMKKMFTELFSHTRNDEVSGRLKNVTRHGIIDRLSHYTLETTTQEFYAKAPDGKVVQGMNIVGVIPGKNRNQPGDDIILIGAHYDTDAGTPGVDDNGSGVVALLEIARMLSPYNGHLSSSVFLVAFDLEERGILGSLAFVNNYLIPNELVAKRTHFVGAYILEMVLNYDNSTQSQIFPLDMVMAMPESALWLQMNMGRGDFVGVWSRKVLDWQLSNAFSEGWRKVNEERNRSGIHSILPDAKMYTFDAAIPRDPLLMSTLRYRAFYNADHASFWTHKSPEYTDYLSAVLITDMGAHRGNMRACYHEFCDDARLLTAENLEFMKRITDAVAAAVLRLSTR